MGFNSTASTSGTRRRNLGGVLLKQNRPDVPNFVYQKGNNYELR